MASTPSGVGLNESGLQPKFGRTQANGGDPGISRLIAANKGPTLTEPARLCSRHYLEVVRKITPW